MRFLSRLLIVASAAFFLVNWASPSLAQDKIDEWTRAVTKAKEEYRVYFKKPQKPLEYWAAIDFEVEVGKFDVAAVHLKMLLAQPADKADADLLKVEAVKGMRHFLRLREVPRYFKDPKFEAEARKNVETLIQRVAKSLDERLSDPQRIRKYIKNLQANTREERAFAFQQLRRSQERASSYLAEELRELSGKVEQERLKRAIIRLDDGVMVPFVEALKAVNPADFNDMDVRLPMLELFRKKRDKRAIPYLWHIVGSERYPSLIRAEAKKTLAALLLVDVTSLPDPRAELTRLALKFGQHRVRYYDVVREMPRKDKQGKLIVPSDFKVKHWPWNGSKLSPKPQLMPSLAMDYFMATRHIREALDIDPSYKPAQRVMLNMILEQQFADNLNTVILKDLPKKHHDLLATLNTDLLMSVLEKAMNERNVSVMLPIIRVLGARGETRAVRASNFGPVRGLARGLYYPDRRVQRESMQAVIGLPGKQSTVVTARVVQMLKRFMATGEKAKLVVVCPAETARMDLRAAAMGAGYEPVFVRGRNDALKSLHHSADIDAIIVHSSFPDYELPYLLSNLHKDVDAGSMPVLILAPLKQQGALELLAIRYPRVVPTLQSITAAPAELKAEIDEAIILAMAPKYVKTLVASSKRRVTEHLLKSKGVHFTAAERQTLFAEAVYISSLMAKGTIKGYDLRPAKDAIYAATRSKVDELASKAIEAYARFAGVDVQKRLAQIVLDSARKKEVRLTAAENLNVNINAHGLYLNRFQLDDLSVAHNDAKLEDGLRRQLAVLIGNIRRSSQSSGAKLRDFRR